MKSEKNTMAKFGKLIHKYTIKDGVEDKAIVPLIYEGRFVDQKVDEENIDLWFKQTTKRLTEAQQEDLKRKWSSIRRLTSTDARIKRIALDISEHFTEGFKDTGFKAMLATNYKRDAIRYLNCFEQFGDRVKKWISINEQMMMVLQSAETSRPSSKSRCTRSKKRSQLSWERMRPLRSSVSMALRKRLSSTPSVSLFPFHKTMFMFSG